MRADRLLRPEQRPISGMDTFVVRVSGSFAPPLTVDLEQPIGYKYGVAWEVEYTDEFGGWWEGLSEGEQESVRAGVLRLEEKGPALGRPLADTVSGSRHPNMKELRPPGGNLRVLFAFDPRRMAILLVGGDKTDRWREFYEEKIPEADRLYDEHLEELREQGEIP